MPKVGFSFSSSRAPSCSYSDDDIRNEGITIYLTGESQYTQRSSHNIPNLPTKSTAQAHYPSKQIEYTYLYKKMRIFGGK